MYIKSIVLDGFKSYGRRTEINGFDPKFTAVTGLNGSGKSNIIDSICFVLGISNLSHVRANSLQDLIFKSGQSGINKATVTIKFDNTNKNQSPPGMENIDEIVITRQVIIGGKNKYLLNGLTVTNKRIQDIFCSVQMNVNNPHFLIMQGKITKVLNMKPPEILAMLEEAAGTRMYEFKKQIAIRNLEKKNSKLDELKTLFYEDVEPRIIKLREEREKVFELQRLEGELSHSKKLFDAWQYHIAEIKTAASVNDIKKVENNIESIKDTIQENLNNIKTLEEEAENIIKETKNMENLQLEELETKLKEERKLQAEMNAIDKATRENICTEERNIKQLEKNIKIDENALKSKELELSKVKNLFETLKNNEASDAEALAICQKKYEAICAGMEVNESGEAQTLTDQLISAKQELAQAEANLKIYQNELEYSQQQLKVKQQNLGMETSSYAQDKAQLENLQKEIKNLQNTLNKLNFSENHMNQLQDRRKILTSDVKNLRDSVESFYASKSHTRCIYTDPEPNFNRRNVHGVVCNLIEVQNKTNTMAIETAAGGMLYSVVVDTDVVSKKLIERGNLQRRTTFIPLNKVRAQRMNSNVIQLAYNLVGKENVTPALNIISYDKRLEPAMESIFGNIFITKDLNVAKKVCYHNGIRKKCVTLEGDVVDPAGTLSGGSMQKNASILILLEQIKKQEAELKQKESELAAVQAEMQSVLESREQWTKHVHQLELAQHQYSVTSKRLEQTTHHMQITDVEKLKVEIGELTEKLRQCEEIQRESRKVINDLEFKMKDSKGHQERQRKDIENELNKLRNNAEKSRQEWAKREEEYRTLNLEIEELKAGIESSIQEIKVAQKNVSNLKEKHQGSNLEVTNIENIVKERELAIKAEKDKITSKNKTVQQKYRTKDKLIEENNEHELQIKKMEYELKKVLDEQKLMKSKLNELNKICTDTKLLNEAKRLSDIEGHALEKKIRDGIQKKNDLSKVVNVKAHQLYEHEVKAYDTLRTKISEVAKDLVKIEDTIKKLDRTKENIINKAFEQVTKDLGSILGTLLPGANAKLKVPNGKTILQGLEVNVALGGVWKESLDELSGGQRSLVALSFILALLLFKPAPLYILDEVDAALDLSHTQNIGAMLKKHFRQSQFIIISLKDGMFNNANVLFRTQFVDGMSTVIRSTNF